ncbi:MAG: hypothetical protein WD294_09115 [Phycisphaeraceae bacterium]
MSPNLRSIVRVTLLVLVGALGAEPGWTAEPTSVFDVREIAELRPRTLRVQRLMGEEKFGEAEREARELIELIPRSATPYYLLARALARQDESTAAIEQLEQAVARGFFEARQFATDPHLRSLHNDPAFVAVVRAAQALRQSDSPYLPLIEPPETVTPAEADAGKAVIGEANTTAEPLQPTMRSYFRFPEALPADRNTVRQTDEDDDDPVADLLNRWYALGKAAGNHGDLYDNRDRGHSRLSREMFPQLTHLEYSGEARNRRLEISAQRHFLFNHITLGNSSMAVNDPVFWRSLPRLLMTQTGGMQTAYQQYTQGHLYVYPSHHDHRTQDGDLFPANTPYMIISQGSSGSDQPFLRAVASTLAAFDPQVKRRLAQAGLLMPTVQMIFRRCNTQVRNPEDYLTGEAHPSVFRDGQLDVKAMVEMAQAMRLDQLPPMVQLKVAEETLGKLGRDYFARAPRERLFDTPAAIARIFRTSEHTKRMVISAEGTVDLNDHPLTLEWVVLRGDAEAITITPRNDAGTVAEIEVPYHGRGRVSRRSDISSHRVDIGVFAHNGHHYSAPAFVSIYFLPDQRRSYENGRIQRIDYADSLVGRRYSDPALALPKDWADEYFYDGNGRLLGWTRVRGEQRARFTRDGARVIETDERNRPKRARTVEYVAEPQGEGEPPQLVEQPGDTILHYEYEGPGDPIGRVTRRSKAE